MDRPARPLSFFDGIGVGLTIVAIICLLMFSIDGTNKWLSPSGSAPLAFRVIHSVAWRVGSPVALVVGLYIVRTRRPRQLSLFALGIIGTLMVGATCLVMWLRAHELFGGIAG